MKRKIQLLSKLLLCTLLFTSTIEAKNKKPNFLIMWGDDIGMYNLSTWNNGMMGYSTPNIDKIANEGMKFTDYYGEQSCTAGRSSFVTGQSGLRTGMTKVGLPGANKGLTDDTPTIAELLKAEGYATGQFGKNHFGDRDVDLPTNHGFDEFYGNLYHLNAEEEPESPYYPKDPEFKKKFGPRGVIHSYADGRISDTGPLTKKRMETIDNEILDATKVFIKSQVSTDKPFFVWFNTTRMHFKTHITKEEAGKTGQGFYADAMQAHDSVIGELLDFIEDLGIEENTFVMYSTDNGPHYNTFPDAAVTPFRGEKNTNWEGAYRVPCLVKYPGHIQEGKISNDMISHLDWVPTILHYAGNDHIKKDLLKGGVKASGKEFKAHLDGYDMVAHLAGKEESPRKQFLYFSDDADLTGIRMGDWKVVFMEQRAHTMQVWTEPFIPLRIPKIFNLRMDPYERADLESNGYWNWYVDIVPYIYMAQDEVSQFLQTLITYPPKQKAASFSVDQIVEMMMEQTESSSKSHN
ncbi:arylsulfatase [Flammeovirga pectinis]|uniref:Arylsulfatase n=1 Tax=Flammeovirga pectinis TaxID=2494373 RepID=A0A3S9P544_9BACT|nr:arylsulfatase [Flammeovirga pectinis]AZQ63273.1 arylsulfatase [Flammeovirga pectinis]